MTKQQIADDLARNEWGVNTFVRDKIIAALYEFEAQQPPPYFSPEHVPFLKSHSSLSHDSAAAPEVGFSQQSEGHGSPEQTSEPPMQKELLHFINHTPLVLSCLYDIDMMPEQLDRGTREWRNMLIIAAHFRDALISTPSQTATETKGKEEFGYTNTRPAQPSVDKG